MPNSKSDATGTEAISFRTIPLPCVSKDANCENSYRKSKFLENCQLNPEFRCVGPCFYQLVVDYLDKLIAVDAYGAAAVKSNKKFDAKVSDIAKYIIVWFFNF